MCDPIPGVGQRGLKLPEFSLGLWHNFGRTAPLGSREVVRRGHELGITHSDLSNNVRGTLYRRAGFDLARGGAYRRPGRDVPV